MTRGSLAGGLLAGKHANPYLNYDEDQVYKMASAVQAISGLQRNASQTALQFVLARQEVTAAVVGIRTLEQLRDIIAATLAPPLTENEIAYLRSQLPVNYYELHR
ncbi:MAG: aldo/keto reductase [Agriterribacter sp.]